MKKVFLVLLAGIFMACDLCAGTLTSSIDTPNPAVNEKFILTLQYDGDTGGDEPNVRPLQQQFTVLGSSTSTNFQVINGHASRSTIWSYEILARTGGHLRIPAFTVNGDASAPIDIEVRNAPAPPSLNGDESIHTETELDRSSVHVQEQAIVTWRVVSHVPLSDPQLQPPQIENVLTQNLGIRQYQRAGADGGVENVIEQRYAFFPQRSGDITIPAQKIQITTTTLQRFGLGFVAPTATAFEIATQPQPLHVIPAENNQGTSWIPALDLTISQEFSGLDAKKQATVGTAFTRIIKIHAKGISAEQLPPLEFTADNFRIYNDQPALQNEVDANNGGIVGTRTEHAAMIASRSGSFTLPEIRIPWFNTSTSHWEEAVLPASTVTVVPAAGNTASQTTSSPPAASSAPAPVPDTKAFAAQNASAPVAAGAGSSNPSLRVWQAAAAGFLLLWLASMAWMWKQKREPAMAAENHSSTSIHSGNKNHRKKPVTEALMSAAASGDMQSLQQEILRWARQQWPVQTPSSLSDIAQRITDASTASELSALERHLYGNGPAPAEPQQMAAALHAYSKQSHTPPHATHDQLDDLYH